MSTDPSVRLVVEGPVARITLCRPDRRNAVGPPEWQALRTHAEAIARQPAVRVVVLSGEGDSFCAGGDLKTMPERLALPSYERREQILSDASALSALATLSRPIVALLDGACAGAGVGLALVADVRLGTKRTRFAAPFHQVGLTCDFGTSWLLYHTVGRARAEGMLLLRDAYEGVDAQTVGLLHRVYEDRDELDEEGEIIIDRLVAGPAVALAETKRLLWLAATTRFAEALANEAEAQAHCSRTPDASEGVQAFLEKRAPSFGKPGA